MPLMKYYDSGSGTWKALYTGVKGDTGAQGPQGPQGPQGEAGSSSFTGLSDTPSSYSGSGSKLVAVNSGATALEFVDAPATTVPGQSGGSNGNVVRWSSSNTWTAAANTDTIAQLTGLLFRQGGEYYASGSLVTGLSGLTAGSVYYLSTSGGITTTAPTPSGSVRLVVIGKAVSSSSLLFAPHPPIGG